MNFFPSHDSVFLVWLLSGFKLESILVAVPITGVGRLFHWLVNNILKHLKGNQSRVLSGIHLTLMFFALLQKDLFKGMWSLAEGFFKQNFCHACHTRFAVVFPLPSCCVSLLFLSAVTEQSWDTLKASRRRGPWERREGGKKETHLPALTLPSFYILKISRKLKKITSYADFLRRSPENVCVGGYKRDYFRWSKPGCHGLLRVLDSDSLLAEASFLCYLDPLLAGKTVGTVPW